MPFRYSVDQLIAEQALKFPDKVAVQFSNTTITYQNLQKRANQLANFLLANNIQPGDKVALAATRSIEMLVALLAITRVGGVYLPLDPLFPADRLAFMLADADVKLLLNSKIYAKNFHTTASKISIEDAWEQMDNYPDTEPGIKINGDSLAYILYTSGSTGKPKGVQITHHSLLNLLLSMQQKPGLTADDTWLAVATISFDISLLELLLPVITGARLIIADSDSAKDGSLLLNIIRTQNVTVMQATPYTWRIMIASGWDEKLPLKIITGGEALPMDLAEKLLTRCDSLHNYYGPTETTIYSTGKQIFPTDKKITIGYPIANTQVYILDENQMPVAEGHEGELCIGGDGVGVGYINQPGLTAQKFIEDTFTKQADKKVYRTGDLAKLLPDGEIEYLGRIDSQVKLRGFRIETKEIEYNLILLHGIQAAVVIVHEDATGNQRLVAYVVSDDPDIASYQLNYSSIWIEALRLKLPDYMVPADYMVIPKMPLTPNGKIDYKALPPFVQVINTHYVAPESDLEKEITQIWAKYLGNNNIGILDDFFALGGHSLIAVQIMTKINKLTGKLFPIATLFRYPTIQKLAELISSGDESATWKSLVPIKPTGNKMPIYIVHGIGLNVLVFNNIARNVDTEQPVYGLQSRGLNGIDEIADTIPCIAALYVDEILEQNPNGPYAIAGYSIGGYIAIEMAKQLQKQGKEVKMLAMLDANFKYNDAVLPLPKRIIEIASRQVRKASFVITSLVKQPAMTISYLYYMVKGKMLQPLGLFPEKNPEDVPEYMQNIVNRLHLAVRKYKMRPYNGVIDVFMSTIRDYYVDDPKHLGWGKFALGGVRVHKVPGDHLNMLLPPNDVAFARILQHALDEAAQN